MNHMCYMIIRCNKCQEVFTLSKNVQCNTVKISTPILDHYWETHTSRHSQLYNDQTLIKILKITLTTVIVIQPVHSW